MRKLRIALAQVNTTVGDLEGNLKKIIDYIEKAKKQEVDIVAFPELALCGYPPEDLLLKGHFVKDNLRILERVLERASDIMVIVGFVDRDKKKNLYNAAGVIHNGKLKGIYRKAELPNYGVFDEKRYFTPGRENPVFRLGRVTFGVNICEDIWETDGPCKVQVDAGAKLLINISASPYHAGKRRMREKILINRAKQTKTLICYTNLVGGQDELVFDGASSIFNPQGEIIAWGRQFAEDLVIADLDFDSASRTERKVPRPIPKRLSRLEEIYRALVLGTRDYVRKNGFEKVVIGLSGGIDSSLTAVIACDALGKENVIGISMPTWYSSKATQSDVKVLTDNLGIRFIIVSINSIFNMYLVVLEKEFSGLKRDLTEENLQARIRGNILMAFSNKLGWLVLTTGNKSETSVGYCTLYGDMAGGFAVIKDVPKTLVYELAKFRNRKEDRELIPESIFNREPSAELRQDQEDKDTLPPYSVLDPILKAYIEEDESFEEIRKKFSPELVKNIIQMVDRNEYKRRQAPPGIKITPKAFGKDRRFPITNKYRGF